MINVHCLGEGSAHTLPISFTTSNYAVVSCINESTDHRGVYAYNKTPSNLVLRGFATDMGGNISTNADFIFIGY